MKTEWIPVEKSPLGKLRNLEIENFNKIVEFDCLKPLAISFKTEQDRDETLEYIKELNQGNDVLCTCFKTDDTEICEGLVWVFAYETQEELDSILEKLEEYGNSEHLKEPVLNVIE